MEKKEKEFDKSLNPDPKDLSEDYSDCYTGPLQDLLL